MQVKVSIALLLWSLAGMFSSLNAQTNEPMDTMSLSLDAAQSYALQNNIDVVNAGVDKKITKMQTVEIITEGLPNISSQLQYTDNFQLPVSIIPAGSFGNPEDMEVQFGTQHNANFDISISQLVVDGRYFIGLKANKAFLAVSQQQYELTEVEVRQTVANSYYAALTAERSLKLLEKNLKTVEQLLFETQQLYENGFAEELDVDRLSLSLNNLKSSYETAKLQYQLSLNVLKYQIGLDMETPISLTEDLEELLLANSDTTTSGFDHTQRIEYQLLKLQHEVRGYDAQQVRAGYFPSLYGFFNYGFNAQRTKFNFFDPDEPWFRTGQVGFQLVIPIFDSYKKGAQVQQRKLERLKIENQIENFKSQADLDVMTSRNDLSQAIAEYENQKKSLALAQKIFNKVSIMKKEGLASSLELADAESSLTETQGNYIRSIYDLLVNKIKLEKALGKY